MRKIKVIKHEEVIKHTPDLIDHIRVRVSGIAGDILKEVKTSF